MGRAGLDNSGMATGSEDTLGQCQDCRLEGRDNFVTIMMPSLQGGEQLANDAQLSSSGAFIAIQDKEIFSAKVNLLFVICNEYLEQRGRVM